MYHKKVLGQGFSNVFTGAPLSDINGFNIPPIFFVSKQRSRNYKDWLTAGMSYIMLPAILYVSKYMWPMIYLRLKLL